MTQKVEEAGAFDRDHPLLHDQPALVNRTHHHHHHHHRHLLPSRVQSFLHEKKDLQGQTLLPKDYTPNEHSVICGRILKEYPRNRGNAHFRELVTQHRTRYYQQGLRRTERSLILYDIVDAVRSQHKAATGSMLGAFVKKRDDKKEGQWFDIGDTNARAKVADALRPRRTKQQQSSLQKNKRKSTNSPSNQVNKKSTPNAENDGKQQHYDPIDLVFSALVGGGGNLLSPNDGIPNDGIHPEVQHHHMMGSSDLPPLESMQSTCPSVENISPFDDASLHQLLHDPLPSDDM